MNHQEMFFKPGLSVTSINQFYESPRKFWKHSSFNPNRVKTEATPAMIFGRLIHNLILTPDVVEKEFVVALGEDAFNGALDTIDDMKQFLTQAAPLDAEGKPVKFASLTKPKLAELIKTINPRPALKWEIEEEFYKSVGKRTVVSVEDMQKACDMRDAMFANPAVRQLIGNGASEEPVTWFREEGGLLCKCKLDYLRSGLVIEYKTTTSVRQDELVKTVGNFGYHRQLAWEIDAATVLSGERPRGAILIFQDKELYDDIAIFPLSAQALAIGDAENIRAYEEIKRRLASNDWRMYEDRIQEPLDLPTYYKPKL